MQSLSRRDGPERGRASNSGKALRGSPSEDARRRSTRRSSVLRRHRELRPPAASIFSWQIPMKWRGRRAWRRHFPMIFSPKPMSAGRKSPRLSLFPMKSRRIPMKKARASSFLATPASGRSQNYRFSSKNNRGERLAGRSAAPFHMRFGKFHRKGRPGPRPPPREPGAWLLRRPVAVVAVVVAVVGIAVIPVAVPAVVPVTPPAVIADAAVVAGQLGHQVVDPLHAAVDVRPRADTLQGGPQLVERLLEAREVVRGVPGVLPVALHLVVEVGGVAGKLPEVVQHLRLVLVRPAVVARGLAINVAGGLVKLVRQVGHAVHVAVVGVAVVTVRAAIAPVLGLQGRRQQEGEKCGGDQGGASHGGAPP